ncbi:MAG: hypothetical protein ACFFAS_12220 [Promethearchaeota archaeon]
MISECIIALSSDKVGLCALDFFSFGHICLGIAIFLLISLLYTIPKHKGHTPIISLLLVFILTVIALVLWEVIENTLLFEIGWKFEDRRDSPINITTDILFGILGALGMWLLCHIVFDKEKKIGYYYIFGGLCLAFWIIFYIVGRVFTL